MFAAVVYDVGGYFFREVSYIYELSRGGGVDVYTRGEGYGGGQVVRLLFRQQVSSQGVGRVLRGVVFVVYVDFEFDLFQFGGIYVVDQCQVFYFFEVIDVFSVFYDVACYGTRYFRQGYQFFFRGSVDVESFLIYQDVVEVVGCVEFAVMGQVRGVSRDGAVVVQGVFYGGLGLGVQEGFIIEEEFFGQGRSLVDFRGIEEGKVQDLGDEIVSIDKY